MGYAVTRPIVDYIVQHQHVLFDYQGEDVSLGIWLAGYYDSADIFRDSNAMVNNKDCSVQEHLVIGHSMTVEDIQACWERKTLVSRALELSAVEDQDNTTWTIKSQNLHWPPIDTQILYERKADHKQPQNKNANLKESAKTTYGHVNQEQQKG